VQDVRVNLNDAERETVIRSMLAISHIEAKVKTFWAKVGDHLPKPEIAKVGVTFGDSEARHEDAYSHAIELLGLNDRFKTIEDVPAIRKRSNYLEKVNSNSHATDPRDYFESIILFSMFVENVSLFSQFYVIMAFNKEKSYLKGISNAVQATSKEEVLHAQFGFDLVNTIKRENPTWWSQDLRDYIVDITREAFEAEKEIIDWIYEEGDNEVCPKATNIELVKQRLNDSLVAIGIDPIFEIDPTLKKQTEWFDVEVMGTTEVDFFNKRSVAYTRYNKSVQAEDLF
jgi:ribonucleoside-diphosphate reductase beta chain